MRFNKLFILSCGVILTACEQKLKIAEDAVKPELTTEQVNHDTDDPAIWINHADTMQSLIIGTDKDTDGALYAFDLDGKIVKRIGDLKRPNNVDVAYGLQFNGQKVDIAVVTERETNKIRIFQLPELNPIDNGGIPVFEGETQRAPMGIAMYTRPSDSAIFAIVGRKDGPAEGYLWQYELRADSAGGYVTAGLVRKFGTFSGQKEIEAIAVDNRLGYVYYSDENIGVRKYYADPAKTNNAELALFGQKKFLDDNEGISIYPTGDSTGYILVSNQQDNSFLVFPREGTRENPNDHPLVGSIPVSTMESDGSEITPVTFGGKFPGGLFVAMSNGKVFQYYAWDSLYKKLK